MNHNLRINGNKYNFNTLSDDELINMMGYALERVEQAERDASTNMSEMEQRHLVPEELTSEEL